MLHKNGHIVEKDFTLNNIISQGDLGDGSYYISASVNDPVYYSSSLETRHSASMPTFDSSGNYDAVFKCATAEKDSLIAYINSMA